MRGIVRVGDTVRKPWIASSPFVAQLLEHLEMRGFSGAPRYLGRDDAGRGSFSYIPGDVPEALARFSDEQIRAAGTLLRAFHDATRDCPLAAGGSVVCHGDPAPQNTVFRDGLPVAFIDFDLAAPADPMEDLAYMAWTWCLSSQPERGPVSFQAKQLRVLTEAYGFGRDRSREFVEMILDRQDANIRLWSKEQDGDNATMWPSSERRAEFIDWTCRERAFVARHRAEIVAALA